MIKVNRFASKEEAAAAAGEILNQLLLNYKKSPVLLMLSGGSAFALLEYISVNSLGENLSIAMLDERFSQDPAVNNFLQLQKLDFYVDAQQAECSFFGTMPRPKESQTALARRFENNLKQWQQENPQGKIFATLGMGQDGHTAGIFPWPENPKQFDALFSKDNQVASYAALSKTQFPERITTTLTFFSLIDFGIGFVCGQDKQAKLKTALGAAGKISELPAWGWHKIKQVEIFTDIQAT